MSISPVHYDLHLEPDLSTFTFKGRESIHLKMVSYQREMILNALELDIHEITLGGKKLDSTYDLEKQELTVQIPEGTSNEFIIDISYDGKLNDGLSGWYQSKYTTDGVERTAAVTQFQEADARRAYVCFDEPGLKATYDIEFLMDKNLDAISNESIIEETAVGDDKKLVKFGRTPIMSTYLVFFGIGEFEAIEMDYNGKPVRVLASPGNAKKYGEFGCDFGVKTLKYAEEYFDIEYPISKLDMIATPAFAFGAMENWGAVVYRENLLLRYPGITSYRLESTILMIIAHELTHQWFGNLVSPKTWKYMWLNESFATYFGYGIVDHYYKDRKIWEFFAQNETAGALNSDAYHESAPIELTGDKIQGLTIKNVNILYNKGGSVLRQLEAYMGADGFRDGLRVFLNKFAYDVATSEDLWGAFQEASGEPITELMNTWVYQLGYPMISVKRDENQINVTQNRYTYLKNDDDTLWMVPLTLKVFFADKDPEVIKFLLNDREGIISLPENVISFKFNLDLTGFYRVKYDENSLKGLGPLIQNNRISNLDKWNIELDQYALIKTGDYDVNSYLEFIQNYINDSSHLSLSSIAGHLFALYKFAKGETKDKIAEVGKDFLENVLGRIGYDPVEGEDRSLASIRGDLITNAVRLGSEKIKSHVINKFDELKEGNMPSADLLGTILALSASITNDYDWFINRYESADNEQEKVLLTTALSSFSDIELIEKTKFYIFEHIPPRSRGQAIGVLRNNPVAVEQGDLWQYYIANLDNFEKLSPLMYQGILTGLLPELTNDEEDIKQFFEGYLKKKPMLQDAIDVALESMEINKQIKSFLN